MTGLNKFIRIDKTQNIVTAEAGINLDTLYDHMIRNDVAFGTLPNVGAITLGGATVMCTHGSTFDCGTFASLVHRFKAVIYRNDKTEIVECFSDSEDEEQRRMFEAFFPSFGTLGIVYELTMKTVPNFNQLQVRSMITFENAHGNIRKLFEECKVQYFLSVLNPINNFCVSKSSIPVSPFSTAPTGENLSNIYTIFASMIFFYSSSPSLDVGWFQKLMQRLLAYLGLVKCLAWVSKCPYYPFPLGKPQVLKWHHAELENYFIKSLKRGTRWINLEYAIPFEKVDVVFKDVTDYVREHINGKNFVVYLTLRACGADECGYLNPCKGRKTVFFDATYDINTPKGFYLEMERILISHGGRVSWPRLFFSERTQFLKNFPEFDKFLEMKKTLDPKNVFGNEWSNGILFGSNH